MTFGAVGGAQAYPYREASVVLPSSFIFGAEIVLASFASISFGNHVVLSPVFR